MCIQLLPIKEVGKLLFTNQIVEEHVDSGCISKVKLSYGDINCYRHPELEPRFNADLLLCTLSYSFHENIPVSPIQEIQTPPPNPYIG